MAGMTLLIAYNLYYDWRFGAYIEQQRQQAGKKPEQPLDDKAATPGLKPKPEVATTPADGVSPGPIPGQEGPSSFPVPGSGEKEKAQTQEVRQVEGKRLISIKNGVTEVVLSNLGAVLSGYRLDEYKDTDGSHIDLHFNFYDYYARLKAAGESTAELDKVTPYPTLGLKFPWESFSKKINGSIFATSEKRNEIVLEKGDKPYVISFEFADPSGVTIRKTYTFYPQKYSFDFSVLALMDPKLNKFDYSLVWFGLGEEKEKSDVSAYAFRGPVAYVNKSNDITVPEDDNPQVTYRGNIAWAGLTNHYYTAVGIPEETADRTAVVRYIDKSNFEVDWNLKAQVSDKPENFTFFVGPKRHDILGKYKNGMYAIINYGWFDFLAKPLFWLLEIFHNITGNWGWAIIGLTTVIKVVFYPLSQKSFRSMKKMQKVQPLLKKIQETYKDDKEKLNQAMMSLYKEHKVNPLGGCLPMLLQMPIFFALYRILLGSIELKGAGWILWITDLSVKDPYYITPVLMGGSMLAQQLMTPQTGDKTQRYMMLALPVVFTFIFLSFPAGLVIYWLVNNILTIIQQWVIYREAK